MDERLSEHIEGVIERVGYLRRYAKTSIVFVRYYNAFNIEDEDSEILERLKNYEKLYDIRYIRYQENNMYDAFDPILPWIKGLYEKHFSHIPFEELMEACNVYPLHREMLANYFDHGLCERTEDIIVNEIDYDYEQFIMSLIRILDYMSSRKKIVFIMGKLHLATQAVLDFLAAFISEKKCSKLSFVAGYNEAYKVPAYKKESWEKVIDLIQKEKLVLDWEIRRNENRPEESGDSFTPDRHMAEKYEERLYNMKNTLCLGDANYYAGLLKSFFEVENQIFDENTRTKMLITYAYISVYQGNYKMAFQLYEKLRKQDPQGKNSLLQYECNKIMVLAKVYGGQRKAAYVNVMKCNEIAEKSMDEEQIFESHVLRCIVELSGWRDISQHRKNINIPENFEKNAKKYHWMNHLSYIYFFGLSEDIFDGKTDNGEDLQEKYYDKSVFFKRGMEIAETLQNDEAKLCAWQKLIMLASSAGQFGVIQYYYSQILKVLKRCRRENDEAQIYNGNGYYHTVSGEFEKANRFFKMAMDIFMRLKQPEWVCESLYNIAINCMNIGDYKEVERCVKFLLDIMKIIRLERIRVANRSKIYGMLVGCYIQMNRTYDAKLYLDKMKDVLRHILESSHPNYDMWEDDMFLYYLLEGMLAKREKNYSQAESMFAMAEKMWRMSPINQFYIFHTFALEAIDMYLKMGNIRESERIKALALEYFQKTKQLKIQERFLKQLSGEALPAEKAGKPVTKSEQQKILEMAQGYALKQEVSNKKKGMTFFENWAELLNYGNDSVEYMIETAMATMENNYNIDRLIYLNIESGIPKIKYCDKNVPVSGNQIKEILRYFTKNKKSVVVNRFDNNYNKYNELTGIFGENEIFSMVGIPIVFQEEPENILIAIRMRHENFTEGLVAFTDEDMEIFKATFIQLLGAIARENIKLQLEISSVTDLLTGLLNRQGFKKKMESLLMGYGKTLTVLYMDLDNFKFCNDHFGHDTGDAVLIAFSRLLEVAGGCGNVITRYGGDEFVMVLPNRSGEDGVRIAQQILDMIKIKQGFQEEIKTSCKGKTASEIQIPPENQITCSIGIASDICTVYEDMNGILMKADKALYQVKNTTKGNYQVWQCKDDRAGQ